MSTISARNDLHRNDGGDSRALGKESLAYKTSRVLVVTPSKALWRRTSCGQRQASTRRDSRKSLRIRMILVDAAQTAGLAVRLLPRDRATSWQAQKGESVMKSLIVRFVRDDQGQDLIEYALLGSFVSLAAYAGANALGQGLSAWYTAVDGKVDTAASKLPDIQ